MKKGKIVRLCFVFLLSCSFVMCTKNWAKTADCQTINIEKGVDADKKISLQEISLSIDYVPLESNDSLILSTTKALVTKTNILVVDNDMGLLLFDKKGKLIRKIGRKGQGPGEYRSLGTLANVCVDEEKQKIFLETDNMKDLMQFDYDGRYSKFININSCNTFIFYKSNVYAHKSAICFRGKNKNLEQLQVFDASGKMINKFHPVDLRKTNYFDMFLESPSFSVSNDKLFYYLGREDTIYQVNKTKLFPSYALHLGKYSFSSDYKWDYYGYQKARKENKVWVQDAYVTDAYVFLLVNQKQEKRVMVYDRNAKKLYNRLVNNTDCVPITYLPRVYNNKIVISVAPEDLLECKNRGNLSDNLQLLLKRLREGDNPVLRVVHLK